MTAPGPILRSCPEDFVVEEVALYEPAGEGGHTFVWVEKRLRNTEEVARALARAANVAPRDVGYAGRKDRVAVARQWFSVPGFDPEQALAMDLPGLRVLDARRHPHKLRTGQLRGNRFEIAVRGVEAGLAERAAAGLAEAMRRGLPNRFGDQRFGRDGANVAEGLALLRGEERGGRRSPDRRAMRFAVSALQAAVFNDALRLRTAPLDALEPGDVALIHASGGLFVVEDAAAEGPRALRGEVSATGPIFGTKTLVPSGAPAAREREAMAAAGLDPDAGLPRVPGLRLRGGRRPVRMLPSAASSAWDGGVLWLRFTLPAGSYATVVVEELLGTPPGLA